MAMLQQGLPAWSITLQSTIHKQQGNHMELHRTYINVCHMSVQRLMQFIVNILNLPGYLFKYCELDMIVMWYLNHCSACTTVFNIFYILIFFFPELEMFCSSLLVWQLLWQFLWNIWVLALSWSERRKEKANEMVGGSDLCKMKLRQNHWPGPVRTQNFHWQKLVCAWKFY